jgi:hypothetical protein
MLSRARSGDSPLEAAELAGMIAAELGPKLLDEAVLEELLLIVRAIPEGSDVPPPALTVAIHGTGNLAALRRGLRSLKHLRLANCSKNSIMSVSQWEGSTS